MKGRSLVALISGIAFIVLGVLFALDGLGWIDVSASLVLPVLMISVGAAVALGGRSRTSSDPHEQPPDAESPPPQAPTE